MKNKKDPKDIFGTFRLNGAEAFVLACLLSIEDDRIRKIVKEKDKDGTFPNAERAFNSISCYSLFNKFYERLLEFGIENNKYPDGSFKAITILGYYVKYSGGLVHFGCKKMTLEEARELAKSAKNIIEITEEPFTIDHQNFELADVETFQKWLDKLPE